VKSEDISMSDKDWAGVLSRWGNGVEDMSIQQRQSSKTVSKTSGEAIRHSSSLTSSSREARSGSGVLGSLNREAGSRSEDTEAAKRSGWSGLKRSESQLRDRAERSASAAAASVGARPVSRPRWSYRGSESPGKENVEAGDRSRSVTRSPASRLFSSTASSRAKQITASTEPVRPRQSGASSSRIPVRSGSRGTTASTARASSSPPQRRQRASSSSGQGQDRGSRDSRDTAQLQSYTDFRQVADSNARKQSGGLGGSKSYSSLHRSGSTGQRKSSSSSGVSTSYSTSENSMRKTSSGSGSVKISLSSLKKATVDSWDGQENVNNNSGKQGKRKSISSVYIG